MKPGYVYIISNKNKTTFYIGVTNNLERRILEHKTGLGSKFAAKYLLADLLYFENFQNISDAILREKQLKNWHRDWKINLIKQLNPDMKDMAADWFTEDYISEYRQALIIERRNNNTHIC